MKDKVQIAEGVTDADGEPVLTDGEVVFSSVKNIVDILDSPARAVQLGLGSVYAESVHWLVAVGKALEEKERELGKEILYKEKKYFWLGRPPAPSPRLADTKLRELTLRKLSLLPVSILGREVSQIRPIPQSQLYPVCPASFFNTRK